MATPFTLPFTRDDRRYLYDVNSNNIVEVDESLYALVGHANRNPAGAWHLASRAAAAPSEAADGAGVAPESVLAEIDRAHRENGLFSDRRPGDMGFPFSKEELGLILNHLLGHVILNVTENCNLRCSYCKYSGTYRYARTHNDARMGESVALSAIRFMLERSDYLVEHSTESLSVGFYGGEPLLNYTLLRRCVDYVGEHYPRLKDRLNFSLTTNLTVANEAIIDYLVDTNMFVLVSLDGPEALHDRYRRSVHGGATFQRIMANLRRMKARNEEYYRTHVGFSVVLAPPYDLKALVDFFAREELTTERRLVLSFVDDDDTTFFSECCPEAVTGQALTEQMEALRQVFEGQVRSGTIDSTMHVLNALFGDKLRDVYTRPRIKLADRIYPNGICIPGYNRFLVDPRGRFFMCEKIGYELGIGDLERGFDLDAISRTIQDYIALSQERCVSCWALRMCKMCFTRALRGDRLDLQRKDENCQVAKQGILRALKMFAALYESNPGVFEQLYKRTETKGGMELAFRFIREHRSGTVVTP